MFIEWFYNHPSLRYGGYSLIVLILFIPVSIYISKFSLNKNFKNRLIFLIIFSLVIFIGRNIYRINLEVNKYDYDLFNKPYYMVNKDYFRISQFIQEIKQQYEICKNKNDINCSIYNGIRIEKKNNYYFLTQKK